MSEHRQKWGRHLGPDNTDRNEMSTLLGPRTKYSAPRSAARNIRITSMVITRSITPYMTVWKQRACAMPRLTTSTNMIRRVNGGEIGMVSRPLSPRRGGNTSSYEPVGSTPYYPYYIVRAKSSSNPASSQGPLRPRRTVT